MKNLFLGALMLAGTAAFAQEQPAKQTTTNQTTTTTTQQPAKTETKPANQAQSQPAKATTKTEAVVKEEKTTEKKAEPAKKSN